jgi:hypothetical protein
MAQHHFEPKPSTGQSSTAAERSLRGKIGAHSLHAKYDSRDLTAPGRKASAENLNKRLLAEIDPRNELPEGERARRLDHARRAYFSRLALKRSRKARPRGGNG